MGQITLQIPQVGLANSTEDPKVASDFTTLQTLVNGHIDLTNFSTALQAIVPSAWQSYSPAWSAGGAAPSIGNGTLAGYYQTFNKTCVFRIALTAGSTTSGGTLGMQFTVPLGAHAVGSQLVSAWLFAAGQGTNWQGFGIVIPGTITLIPEMPAGSGFNQMANMQNADVSGGPGTGIPNVGASYPIQTSSTLVIQGAYQTS